MNHIQYGSNEQTKKTFFLFHFLLYFYVFCVPQFQEFSQSIWFYLTLFLLLFMVGIKNRASPNEILYHTAD